MRLASGSLSRKEDYCAKGGHFGPHNLHENRPESFVFVDREGLLYVTDYNAGLYILEYKGK